MSRLGQELEHLENIETSTGSTLQSVGSFVKSSLKEISPWENIKSLHTNIRADILAGITVAIIALPLALAFGEMSQLGPVAGIWGAIAGGIVGGLFGGSMVGVSGPTAPKAAQIAAFMGIFVIGTTSEPDLIAAFSIIFLSGVILVAISMVKIARFIHYTPYSVVAGFMCGIGVIVILTQINAFVGLEAEKNIEGVFENFGHTIQNINIEALYVAIPSLLILFLWIPLEKKYKFLKNIPSPLVALIVGTGIAYFMNLDIPYIGDKMGNANETKIFSFYIPDLTRIGDFMGPALALAGLAVLDSLLSCIVADNMTGTHHSSDRETFGQGMANMAAGLLGGVTTATATMRTVANIKFGGKTPLASIVHGLTLLTILLGLGFLVAAIPTACLAAILFKVGIDILDYRILPVLKKLPVTDLLVFGIVLFVTVYEDLMIAMAIGVVFAFFRFVQEVSSTYQHKTIPLSKSDFAPKGQNKNELDKLPVSVLQPQGPLFFGSIEPLMNAYAKAPKHDMLIVDMSNVTMIDLSGAYALEDLIKDAETKDIKVFVSNATPHIKEVLEKVDFIKHIGKEHYVDSKQSIIPFILEHYNLDELKFKNKKDIDSNLPILHKLHTAINNHDLNTILNLYADDAILIPAFSNRARKGKEEIQLFYKEFFENDKVKISMYQVSSQEANELKIDTGMYLMRWMSKVRREEEYLRFMLIVKDGKIVSDNSSIEPNFNSVLNSNLPLAYAEDFNE
jgi:SulP family sulfate permease